MKGTELLLQYQKLGDRVATLRDEQRHIEERLAGDAATDAAAAEEAAASEARSAFARELREMEAEVEGHRAKMKSHDRELMSGRIRSPSDLTRMSAEVEHMKTSIGLEEDRELELMAALEEADTRLETARRALLHAREAVAASAPALSARAEAVTVEVAELEAEREALWAEVPEPARAAFRKLGRVVHPVVAMVDGQCEGCRVRLTANELQQLRRGERFTCQNCNRILVPS
ncbi:MAG: C4-type zinc ribbon domain-containing protein [Candidatus Dormibacteraeota bacterium]|nr:C4-type zinc ribbon domain-containing protein [Candidatus Dormibacteraeota bacterium]